MQAQWWAGFGAADITPPTGLEMAGFGARYEVAQGTHDPLRVRALALKIGEAETPLLLLAFDLLGLSQALVSGIKARISGEYGVTPERILLAATHTHAGPATLDHELLGNSDKDYLARLPEKALAATRQAIEGFEAVTLHLGSAIAQEAGRNRNVFNGPTDPVAGVLAARSVKSGQLVGCLVNYTCHPTVLGPDNLLYTADYPYYTTRVIAEASGLPVERIVFSQGACGDINAGHTSKSSFSYGGAGVRTYQAAERLGGNVGQAAVAALQGQMTELAPMLEVGTRRLKLNWQMEKWPNREAALAYGREQQAALDEAQRKEDRPAAKNLSLLAGWAEVMQKKSLTEPWPAPEMELTAVKLGGLNWIAVSGELYVEHGLAIKAQAGHPTWILGYTNGDLGYFPTQEAYDREDYEAALAFRYYGYPAPFEPATGYKIVEAAIGMLNSNQ